MKDKGFDCNKIPSDLLGFFISFYSVKNKKVTFKDSNSLVMKMLSNLSYKYDFELREVTE